MQFTKTRIVKSPTRANTNDAGIDFYIPELTINDISLIRSNYNIDYDITKDYGLIQSIDILPHGRILIPSGIHVRLEQNTALIFMNKSGVASKTGLIIGACVVDESYTGEVHLSLINTSENIITIKPNQKIAQGVIFNMNYSQPTEIDNIQDLYKDMNSKRGSGGFGSTDEK